MNNHRFIIIICSFIACIGFFSCEEPEEDFEPITDFNIFETLLQQDNYSLFAQALTKAGLANRLETQGPFTLFALDDQVIESYLTSVGVDSLNDANGNELRTFLSYHIIEGTWTADNLADEGYLTSLNNESTNGSRISIYFEKNGNNLTLNQQYQANLMSDTTSNGVIHTVETLMSLPRLFDFIKYDDRLNDFEDMMVLANYTSIGPLSDTLTVFAPENAAFPTLFDTLEVSSLSEIPSNTLERLAEYGIADTSIYFDNLLEGNITSSLPERKIGVFIDSVSMTPYLQDFHGNQANFIEGDIQAINGRLHLIDRVLNPD